MPIEVRKALEILSEVLAGEKPKRFFQQNRIALDGLMMEPSQFNHKLKGRQNFTKADYIRLAHYFELGEEGHKVFQEEDEDAFRARLRALGLGKYTNDPAQLLAQKLLTAANQSSATLDFIAMSSSHSYRSGLLSPENAKLPTELMLRAGDRVRLRFRVPAIPTTEAGSLWFIALNIHCTSGAVRVLNPVFKESAIQLRSSQLCFPESNDLEIGDSTLLGSHRLIAIAGTSDFLRTLLDETSRLLAIFNGASGRDATNQFDGLLDRVALQNINQASLTGITHCAIKEYRQVHGVQQP